MVQSRNKGQRPNNNKVKGGDEVCGGRFVSDEVECER